uniref:Odorant receptor n=1 Tax=Galleria mellonella TaxID=7137 RepID=A0A5C0E409_GALME|nr:odorant receptor 26 [Galleria mellonella]
MFKSFDQTFKFCTLAMAIALIYPNKNNIKKRLLCFGLLIISNLIQLYWFIVNIFESLIRLDMANITRHITVAIIVILFLFKTVYCICYGEKLGNLLNTISNDMIEANDKEEDFKNVMEKYIKKAKIGEIVWTILPGFLAMQYPLFAAICLIYDNITADYPQRYMVHEVEVPHLSNVQDDSPYFEFIFVMSLYTVMCLIPNFIGLEGFFCISTTHMCVKLKYVSCTIQKAFNDTTTSFELHNKIRDAIKRHQEALQFYEDLQNFFEPWLFAIFIMTSTCLSFNLYQISTLTSFDPKYVTFCITIVMHTYITCIFSSNLTQCAEEMTMDLYNAPWENRSDVIATKYLIFMIAKAQHSLQLGGYGVVVYNMELFVSIMKTSYSFYTLITSK